MLPILYKKTKTGAIQTYQVTTSGDTITVTQGQLEGKKQSYLTKCTPKNIGRSNATTGAQQASLEAEAKWNKKLKSGYSLEISDTPSVQLPMKVKVYQDQLKNIKFPCVSTPKLNGVNAIYKRVNGNLTIYSRGGEVYPPIPHLEKFINEIMDKLPSNEINGELYIHGEHLQDIQSAVKKPKELSKQLTFAIFDICDSKEDYAYRNIMLTTLEEKLEELESPILDYIPFLTGVRCNSHEDLEAHYNRCMKAGLEGTVIKNLDGLYEHNTRSSNQFKYKKAMDAEYKVIGFKIDKNKEIVLSMETIDHKQFNCKPKGKRRYRQELALQGKNQIGKWWTIEYETLSKEGIPLKGVALYPRKCNDKGTPLV